MASFHWVADPESLQGLVDAVCRSASIAVDTEFVRTETFYARLGVVQIEAGGEVFLVDALQSDNLQTLGRCLSGTMRPAWIIHAGAEDLEVLRACWTDLDAVVFDTQIAAAFVGHPRQASLQSLLANELGINITKDETRSDWCRRPLSDSQCVYAAQDVAHLAVLASRLAEKLGQMGRSSWCAEECSRLVERSLAAPADPESLYLGFSEAWQLGDASLSVLRALVAWREKTARQTNRPRGFILKDPALFRIAETLPRSAQAIALAPGIVPAQVRRYSAVILDIVAGTPVQRDLPRPPPPLDVGQRKVVKALRGAVDNVADRLQLPSDLLATRKWLEDLVRAHPVPASLPAVWGHWRKELLEGVLLATLGRERAEGGSR
jgi:ribonuclease D